MTDNLNAQDLERYKKRVFAAQDEYSKHMNSAPTAAHNRGTNDTWQLWIAGMKRLGNKVIDAQIAYIKANSTLQG